MYEGVRCKAPLRRRHYYIIYFMVHHDAIHGSECVRNRLLENYAIVVIGIIAIMRKYASYVLYRNDQEM